MAAAPPSAASSGTVYDWSTRPQECFSVLQEAQTSLTSLKKYQGNQEEKCLSVLNALSSYLDPFTRIAKHNLLKIRNFYQVTETLKRLASNEINALLKDRCYGACCMTSDDEDIDLKENFQIPADPNQWLEADDPIDILSYLNHISTAHGLAPSTVNAEVKTNIKTFYTFVKTYVAAINYIFENPVTIKDTKCDPNKNPEVQYNSFFVCTFYFLNSVVKDEALKIKLKEQVTLLFKAYSQTEDALSNRSSASQTPVSSPLPKGSGTESPMSFAQVSPANANPGSPAPSLQPRRLESELPGSPSLSRATSSAPAAIHSSQGSLQRGIQSGAGDARTDSGENKPLLPKDKKGSNGNNAGNAGNQDNPNDDEGCCTLM